MHKHVTVVRCLENKTLSYRSEIARQYKYLNVAQLNTKPHLKKLVTGE